MRIIIVGGGTVGVELANKFSEKNQDVILIERQKEKLEKISRNLDIMLIEGNGASFKVLEQAGVKKADILIAVTETDEVNIIACLLAKNYGVNKTVARLRSPEYTEEENTQPFSQEQLGIDIIINPELVTAMEIAKIIRTPNVKGIEYFAQEQVQMVGLTVEENSPVANQLVKDIELPYQSNIVAILRPNKDAIVPGGMDKILPGDDIYLIGPKGLLSNLGGYTRHPDKRADNILIIGGGRIGSNLARILEKYPNGMQVKLVEKCQERCEELTEGLSKTLILQGDGTNLKFLKEEDLKEVDVVVACTGDDKTNLLSSVMSRKLGATRTIVEVIKADYESVLDTLQVDTAISPRTITAAKILKLIRKEKVISMKILGNEKAEILELEVDPKAPIVNKKLSKAKLPKGLLVGAIVRGDKIIIAGGNDMVKANDRVILFATHGVANQVDKFFASK